MVVHDSLVPQLPDSTEAVIQRTIEGIQMMMKPYKSQRGGDGEEDAEKAEIRINPAMKVHWESKIKILQDSPRDADKLREILKVKEEEYDKAQDSEDIERLVSEIEMLKFVLFLVSSDKGKEVEQK